MVHFNYLLVLLIGRNNMKNGKRGIKKDMKWDEKNDKCGCGMMAIYKYNYNAYWMCRCKCHKWMEIIRELRRKLREE